jgi:hypothetical protein
MAWFFEGNGQQVGFSVSANGVLSAYGLANQDCQPDSENTSIVSHVKNALGSWKLCTPANEAHEYDNGGPIGGSLKHCFQENESKATGRISFLPSEGMIRTPTVSLSILAPNDFAASAFTLLRATMGNPAFRFVIIADFHGLSMDHVPTNRIPKVSEFTNPNLLQRRAYFSNRISLTVRTF